MMKNFFRLISLFVFSGITVLAGKPELRYGVESHDVTLQQGFLFQISVQHDKDVPAPVLPAMQDFLVQSQPPQTSSFSNVSIINGRKTSTRYIRTVFNYTLIPQKLGNLVIPQVTVTVDHKNYLTRPITIRVRKPEEYPGIFLETSFSVKKCYVGEPVMIHWTWGFDRDIHGFTANLPIFRIQDFHFPDYMPPIDQQKYKYHEIGNIQQQRLIGYQTRISRSGSSQGCLKFQHPFIPTRPGTYTIPASSITCEITNASRQRQSRYSDPFDDMDDFFGGFFSSRRRATKKVTAVSVPLTLQVLPLPVDRQPSSFSGIIGACRISTSASPVEVNVGEPIILTVKLSGPQILDKIHLPDLDKQENIAAGFKVSSPEPGIIRNNEKIFQLTLRASSPSVREIPPVEISYFNSDSGKYEIASSRPIPIKVTATREITAQDIQGVTPLPQNTATLQNEAPVSQELQENSQGIAHNYDSSQLLYKQSRDLLAWLRRPLISFLFIFPVLLWIGLWTGRQLQRCSRIGRNARNIRKAGPRCLKQLKKLLGKKNEASAELYDILQSYFAARLGKTPGTISDQDLQEAAANNPELKNIALPVFTEILRQCEFNRFSGTDQPLTDDQLLQSIKAVQCWEKFSR